MNKATLIKAAIDAEARKSSEAFWISLHDYLIANGICLRQLAIKIHMNEKNLSDILNGKGNPTTETQHKIIKGLNLKLFWMPNPEAK